MTQFQEHLVNLEHPAMSESPTDIATSEDTAYSHLLVVLDTSVGDLVMNQTLLRLLKEHALSMIIDVVAPSHFRGFIKRMPKVRNHFEINTTKGRFPSRLWFRTIKQIRSENYPASILTPRSTNAGMLLVLAGIARRTGFSKYGLGW